MRSTRLWTFTALGIAAVTSAAFHVAGAAVHARVVHPVDDWLIANPKVADQVIWEFPPPVPYNKPLQSLPTKWTRFAVIPHTSVYPALTIDLFSDRFLARFDNRLESSLLELANEGLDPGRIESTLPPHPKFTLAPKNVVVPGFNPDFIPSGEKVSDQGGDIKAWSQWHEAAKQKLRDSFDAYLPLTTTACSLYAEYAASNFTVKPAGFDAAFSILVDSDPDPVVDPPVNIQPHVPPAPWKWPMLESEDAFALYVRLVAAQLAIEIGGCLPWSVTEYSSAELGLLFDGRTTLRYAAAGPSTWGTMDETGHVVVGTVIPAPPMIALGFLGQNQILGTDRTDTVLRFLEWERPHLAHAMGGATDPPLPAGMLYYGYNGRTPVSRMFEARFQAAPLVFSDGSQWLDPEAKHWVGGCGGASGFNAEVLRVLNIPVERTLFGHQQNRFSIGGGARVSTGHADDPYGLKKMPEIPTAEILLDDITFEAWFINEDPALWDRNSARRSADLQFQYLPNLLLERHCGDLAANRPHETSNVMGQFQVAYTVAEMEAKGLWPLMEAKIKTLGNCTTFGYPWIVIP